MLLFFLAEKGGRSRLARQEVASPTWGHLPLEENRHECCTNVDPWS